MPWTGILPAGSTIIPPFTRENNVTASTNKINNTVVTFELLR